jgi:hypothetical protein
LWSIGRSSGIAGVEAHLQVGDGHSETMGKDGVLVVKYRDDPTILNDCDGRAHGRASLAMKVNDMVDERSSKRMNASCPEESAC